MFVPEFMSRLLRDKALLATGCVPFYVRFFLRPGRGEEVFRLLLPHYRLVIENVFNVYQFYRLERLQN